MENDQKADWQTTSVCHFRVPVSSCLNLISWMLPKQLPRRNFLNLTPGYEMEVDTVQSASVGRALEI